MAQTYYNNTIYSTTRDAPRGPLLNYEDSIYSTGQQRGAPRSVHSAKTGASAYSQVTKKSSDFYRTDQGSYERKAHFTERISFFLYNPSEGTIMGRKPLDWVKALVFYLIIYGVVALIWAGSFALFDFIVLDEDKPALTGMHSALRNTPSLSYIPQPDHYSSLIRFRPSRLATVRKYVDDMVAVTQWYEDHAMQNMPPGEEKLEDCKLNEKNRDPKQIVCNFNLNVGTRCNAFKNFGFADSEPCIALKLNRVYGWVPDPINNSTGVMVRCYGRNPTDRDFIGDICYHYSTSGAELITDESEKENYCKRNFGVFEHYYFPYLRQIRYKSPLVFVEFKGLKKNVVIMVECVAEARNIAIDRTYRIGMAQFELLVD